MINLYEDTGFSVLQEDKDIVEALSGERYSDTLESTLVMSAKLIVLTSLMSISKNSNIKK